MQKIHLLLLGTAIALIATNSHAYYSMPYVGISVGESTNVSYYTRDNAITRTNFRGIPLTVNMGYGSMISATSYLAGEVFGVFSTVSLQDNGIRSKYGYGVSIIPGIMLADHTLGFIRMGLIGTSFNRDTWVLGGQLGCGLQFSVSRSVDLRGEYVYTSYQSFTNAENPQQDAFNFGIVYKFN